MCRYSQFHWPGVRSVPETTELLACLYIDQPPIGSDLFAGWTCLLLFVTHCKREGHQQADIGAMHINMHAAAGEQDAAMLICYQQPCYLCQN